MRLSLILIFIFCLVHLSVPGFAAGVVSTRPSPHCGVLLLNYVQQNLGRPSPHDQRLALGANFYQIHPEFDSSRAIFDDAFNRSAASYQAFNNDPEPNFDDYATQLPLSEMGQIVLRSFKDADVYDLASGLIDTSVAIPALAKLAGARRYVGIDLITIPNAQMTKSDDDGFEKLYFRSDMLVFLSRLRNPIPLCSLPKRAFVLIGVQPVNAQNESRYLRRLVERLERETSKGDAVILGGGAIRQNFRSSLFQMRAMSKTLAVYQRK